MLTRSLVLTAIMLVSWCAAANAYDFASADTQAFECLWQGRAANSAEIRSAIVTVAGAKENVDTNHVVAGFRISDYLRMLPRPYPVDGLQNSWQMKNDFYSIGVIIGPSKDKDGRLYHPHLEEKTLLRDEGYNLCKLWHTHLLGQRRTFYGVGGWSPQGLPADLVDACGKEAVEKAESIIDPESGGGKSADQQSPFDGIKNVFILLQISHSMIQNMPDRMSRIDHARLLVKQILRAIPPDINCGLRVIGGPGPSPDPEHLNVVQKQSTSTVVVSIGQKHDRASILQFVETVKPEGNNALALALAKSFREDVQLVKTPTAVLLISNGLDTSGGNPPLYALQARDLGPTPKVITLSLAEDGRVFSGISVLKKVAMFTSGKYYDLGSADALLQDLKSMDRAAK